MSGPTERQPGEWVNHGTIRPVYESWWVTMSLDDVERPDGSHTEHEVIRGLDAAGVVVLDPARGILMLWRHRFLPDTWGWEIPAGATDPGETPEQTARRECAEETGWEVRSALEHLSTHHPSCGLIAQTFHVFLATAAERIGPPTDENEAAEVAWRPLPQVADDLRSGAISDGFTALAVALALGVTGHGDLLARPGP